MLLLNEHREQSTDEYCVRISFISLLYETMVLRRPIKISFPTPRHFTPLQKIRSIRVTRAPILTFECIFATLPAPRMCVENKIKSNRARNRLVASTSEARR